MPAKKKSGHGRSTKRDAELKKAIAKKAKETAIAMKVEPDVKVKKEPVSREPTESKPNPKAVTETPKPVAAPVPVVKEEEQIFANNGRPIRSCKKVPKELLDLGSESEDEDEEESEAIEPEPVRETKPAKRVSSSRRSATSRKRLTNAEQILRAQETVRRTQRQKKRPREVIVVESDSESELQKIFDEAESDVNADVDLSPLDFDTSEPFVFLDKWIILSQLEADPRWGVSYLVENAAAETEGEMATLRLLPISLASSVLVEAEFLNKMELLNFTHFFVAIEEVNVVQEDESLNFAYTVSKRRLGPTLPECLATFSSEDEFSFMTHVARLAVDMLAIVEAIIKSGYLLVSMDLDQFSFDLKTRRVFLNTTKNVFPGWERTGIAPSKNGRSVSWKGQADHAPANWHTDPASPMSECDCLQSFFFAVLEMMRSLPWKGESVDKMAEMKSRWSEQPEDVKKELPVQSLYQMWLELSRGRLVYLSRENNSSNGELLLGKEREKKGRFSKLKSAADKEKFIPKCSKIDYLLLRKSISGNGAYCRLNDNDDKFPFEMDVHPHNKSTVVRSEQSRLLRDMELLEGDLSSLHLKDAFRYNEASRLERVVEENKKTIEDWCASDFVKDEIEDPAYDEYGDQPPTEEESDEEYY